MDAIVALLVSAARPATNVSLDGTLTGGVQSVIGKHRLNQLKTGRSCMSYGSVPDAMIQNNPNSPAATDGLTLMPQAPRSAVDVGGGESEVTSETESLRERDDDAMAGRAGACWMCVEKRWQLGLLGFTMEAVCYADRTNITLAILEMQKDLGWNEATAGIILSSFFAGYACTQVLGGWAAERWGAKPCWRWPFRRGRR